MGTGQALVIPVQAESLVTKSLAANYDKLTGATTLTGSATITIKVAGKSAVTISGEELTLAPQK
jgi:hypothetical protein